MARAINRLSARKVETLKAPGRHADGGNLYLSISPTGAKSWVFLFRWRGTQKEIGLGSARDIGLARAREIASLHRAQLAEGIEPKGKRAASGSVTFADCSVALIKSMRPGWRSARHAQQWEMTLMVHAAPLAKLPIDGISTADVLRVLEPIWVDRYVTASRLRGRIERVLDFAKARGMRGGENPARWRGHLDHLLPKRPRLEREHLAAMPYAELPGFMERLRAVEGAGARALEFLILTAARSSEVRFARWSEFDLATGTWTVPAVRMKGGVQHVVPLCLRAMEILLSMPIGGYVFGAQSLRLDRVLGRLDNNVTVHGFRSTFRDWCGDLTHYPREVAEAALAHTITNKVEQAYRRESALLKRRELMAAWCDYCARREFGAGGMERG